MTTEKTPETRNNYLGTASCPTKYWWLDFNSVCRAAGLEPIAPESSTSNSNEEESKGKE